jgi:hypothetical protein
MTVARRGTELARLSQPTGHPLHPFWTIAALLTLTLVVDALLLLQLDTR